MTTLEFKAGVRHQLKILISSTTTHRDRNHDFVSGSATRDGNFTAKRTLQQHQPPHYPISGGGVKIPPPPPPQVMIYRIYTRTNCTYRLYPDPSVGVER